MHIQDCCCKIKIMLQKCFLNKILRFQNAKMEVTKTCTSYPFLLHLAGISFSTFSLSVCKPDSYFPFSHFS